VYEHHLVLQYDCTNTVREQVLEDVTVASDLSGAPGLSAQAVLPLGVMPLPGGAPGSTYTVLRREGGAMATGKLGNVLRFRVREVDPSTGARARVFFLPRRRDAPLSSAAVHPRSPASTLAQTSPHHPSPLTSHL
jgi:hypothetical protein